MAYKPSSAEIFKASAPYAVAAGGIETFETEELSDEEESNIEDYLNEIADEIAKTSPKIASDFRNQIGNMKDQASHFKAKVDGKPYGDPVDSPDPGQLGVNPIIPQHFGAGYYDTSADGRNKFTIDITEGTIAYLWGNSATEHFKTDSTTENRFHMFVMQNGIIHIADTPITQQFRYVTEKKTYAAFDVQPLVVETIEENKTIYQYRTYAAFPLSYDLGSNLSFMATRTASGVSYDIIGVSFYEKQAFDSLVWH